MPVSPLSNAERDAFDRDGFIQVRDAIEPGLLERTLAAVDEEDRAFRASAGVGPHHVLNLHDLVGRDDAWLEIIDNPRTFAKVWGILGWNIKLFHTQGIVTPPAPSAASDGAYGWHQDNNRMNRDLETPREHHPRISLKVGYFLTDLPDPGMGNLCVIPGSHRGNARVEPDSARLDAVELLANAGDAVIFDRRLWHAASTNHSLTTRKFVTYGYAYRWVQPKSAMHLDHLYEDLDPVRRQLVGFATSANGYYDPLPDDVPLREHIRGEFGEDAVAD